MRRARYGNIWQFLGVLGLACSLLAGCDSGSGGDGMAESTSRLTLQLTSADQDPGRFRPAQDAQAPIARLQITVSDALLTTLITVSCTLPEPAAGEPCRTIDETEETTLLEVVLAVSRGTNRLITVTAFDAEDIAILRGEETVDLDTDAVQITIVLAPLETTTVVGIVQDQDGNRIAGAAVTTNGGVTGFTTADGTFSIANVPTDLGDIAASAAFTSDQGVTVTGSSPNVPAILGGQTNVGTIIVLVVLNDTVVLSSDAFQIPAGFDTLTFAFNFLSNEFPDFVGDVFDDTSFALVRTGSTTAETRVLASVNTSSFNPAENAGFNGQTGFQSVTFDVTALAGSTTPVTLVISVRDVGDNAVDSALLIDDIRLVDNDTGSVQSIANGNFETGDFTNFTVSFTNVGGPLAGIITGLGDADNAPQGNFPGLEDFDFNGDALLTTAIAPPAGSFMVFLATGVEALSFITSPPSVIMTTLPAEPLALPGLVPPPESPLAHP